MEEILHSIYFFDEEMPKKIQTKYAPLLNEMKRTDPILADFTFLPEEQEITQEIFDRMKNKDLSSFQKQSLLGIAYLLPLLSFSSFQQMEEKYTLTLFLFWKISFYLSSTPAYSSFDDSLSSLFSSFSQTDYLCFFPSYFERETGIRMKDLSYGEITKKEIDQQINSLSSFLPIK